MSQSLGGAVSMFPDVKPDMKCVCVSNTSVSKGRRITFRISSSTAFLRSLGLAFSN